MKLIVGLGNPGDEHSGNRHNVGFMAVDRIAAKHGFSSWRKRFQGFTAEGELGGEKCMILKPQTYMNESGRSVGEAARFLKIPIGDVIVIYDDDGVVAGNPNLWDNDTIYQPWWNVQTMDDLYLQNQASLAGRPKGAIWGLTGEATPDAGNIVAGILLLGPMSNRGFVTRGQPTLKKWLSSDFKTSVNLVTEDWFKQVGATSSSYARYVMAAVYETLAPRLLESQAAGASTYLAVG